MRLLFFICGCAMYTLAGSCHSASTPSPEAIAAINLKRGDAIFCGPSGASFGSVDFLESSSAEVKKDFDQAVAMLHSFEYDEAEKSFAKVIARDPSVAMAYWGVAMSNFHPLWAPPNEEELKKGAKAIEVARSIGNVNSRESAYIEAIGQFYNHWKETPHKDRCKKYEKAMETIHAKNPDDKEAAIFYALALNTTADPADKSYANQRKAFNILSKIYDGRPDHPGIVHYIIHNYDNPELAQLALPAARKYASIAPASAHAQHMPSHIFIRLGLWEESIKSNLASVSSAKCYAESTGLKGSWDEELHGLDYLVYAYLQQGNNEVAGQQLAYLKNIRSVSPQNFKVAYAYAAIPARYLMENHKWKDAAALDFAPAGFPWDKYPWQKGIIHFARLMGKANTNDIKGAEEELGELQALREEVMKQKDDYKAKQLEIQMKAGEAWIYFKRKNHGRAIELAINAADLEDATEKHPVTPGEVIPARELLADLYMAMEDYTHALEHYEADMKKHPNRFNALYNAGRASEKLGDVQKAGMYYSKLLTMAVPGTNRPELQAAKRFTENKEVAKL